MFTFVESSVFEAVRPVYLEDDEYAELLSLYAKAKSDNIPGHILKELLEVFRNG